VFFSRSAVFTNAGVNSQAPLTILSIKELILPKVYHIIYLEYLIRQRREGVQASKRGNYALIVPGYAKADRVCCVPTYSKVSLVENDVPPWGASELLVIYGMQLANWMEVLRMWGCRIYSTYAGRVYRYMDC